MCVFPREDCYFDSREVRNKDVELIYGIPGKEHSFALALREMYSHV
jgi:hypothetical protein